MVGLQTLDLAIGVRVPASQPNFFSHPNNEKLGTLDLIHGVDYALELHQVRAEDLVSLSFA